MHQVVSIEMEKDLLKKNRELAEENHSLLKENGIRSVDILGSIGSGKTMLIERMTGILKERGLRPGAITGDVAGDDDYRRVSDLKIPAVNVNTGKECHIDAHLAEHALEDLDLENIDFLLIENVGNLVCPADFPLGTDMRIVVISVTEGEDMVRKHPNIFREADLIVINKSDLAGVMDVDVEVLKRDANTVRPDAEVFLTDAKHNVGIEELVDRIAD